MKHLKKIMSLILTAIMVIAMCVPVMAEGAGTAPAGSYKITIEHASAGHVYEAYQIFVGDLSSTNNILSNIVWGNGVSADGQTALGAAETKAASLKTVDDAAVFAKAVANYLQNPTASGAYNKTTGKYEITGLSAGYYLVKDQDNSLNDKEDFYTAYIMKVVGDVVATPKGDKPSLNKQIKHNELGSWGVVGDNQIGDTVYFRTITTVPDVRDYTKYDYIISDTMSAGLTSNVTSDSSSIKIVINDANENAATDVDKVLTSDYYTVRANGNSFTVTVDIIKAIKDRKISAGQSLYTYYDAILNKDALIYDVGKQQNTAHLEYSNNPNDTKDKGKTPDKIVYDWTFKMGVNKTDSTGKNLTGAKFVLSKNGSLSTTDMDIDSEGTPNTTTDLIALIKNSDGTYTVAPSGYTESTTYVIEAGNVTIKGLDDSVEYCLYETKAPEGYNLLKQPVKFNISVSYETDGSAVLANNPTVTVDNGTPSTTLSTDVVNNVGSSLPSTGGVGTTIFYVVGVILMLGAGVLLVTKKRMSSNR